MEKVEGSSLDLKDINKKIISDNFPEVMIEGKIDFEKLKLLLGDNVDNSDEKYQFVWNGKNEAIKLYQASSLATLLPCKEKSVNWDTTENLYIEGDNLEVLKLLQKHYYGKIKMIYIDPPYNTGNDFVYKDNFKDSIKNYKEQTQQTNKANAETNGRYHTDWLNLMYPRLKLAKDLLAEDGVICISIDDNEISNMKKICDELYGETNFVANFIWRKIYGIKNDVKHFSVCHDYILIYAKNINKFSPNLLPRTKEANARYKNPDNDYRGDWKAGDFTGAGATSTTYEIVSPSGKKFLPPEGKHWIASYENYLKLLEDNRMWFGPNGDKLPSIKRFLSEVKDGLSQSTFLDYTEVGHSDEANRELNALMGGKFFDYPKPVRLLYRLIYLMLDKESIVLDFFSGSATTAHAVMELNKDDGGKRKYIMVQLPEVCDEKTDAFKNGYKNICEIAEERIRRAGKKIKEETNADIDYGFKVFKLDTSNVKVWNPENLNNDNAIEKLLDSVNPIVDDRTTEDLLYEIILKEGYSLTAPVETIEIDAKDIYSVGMGYMVVVLDEFTTNTLNKIGEINPNKVVFKDSIFKDENEKFNTIQELKKYGIEENNIRSI